LAGDDTSLSGIAGRYAQALLDLADEKRQLDDVAGDLRAVKALLAESDNLREVARSPLYTRAQQTKAFQAILERMGVGELTRRFIFVVAENRRLFALSSMIDAYLAELARRRGEVRAKVTTARKLTDQQHDSLVEALRGAVGGKVQVDVAVDPSLIGGLVVKVGSRMIDNSLKTKLQRLQLAMKGVG
jgi:F-type H+-transporting ATPase subunit delta